MAMDCCPAASPKNGPKKWHTCPIVLDCKHMAYTPSSSPCKQARRGLCIGPSVDLSVPLPHPAPTHLHFASPTPPPPNHPPLVPFLCPPPPPSPRPPTPHTQCTISQGVRPRGQWMPGNTPSDVLSMKHPSSALTWSEHEMSNH